MTKKNTSHLLAAICGAALLAGPVSAEDIIKPASNAAHVTADDEAPVLEVFARLSELAHLAPLMQVVATEGARHGIGLEGALFPGRGGDSWANAVGRIQSPDRLVDMLEATLRTELSRDDASAVSDFYAGDVGRRLAAREVSARHAMLDAKVESDAISASTALTDERTPRAVLIGELIDTLDLVTANVTGGLNANFAFYQGLGDGGALRKRLTEREMLAMVWSQEGEVRERTRKWLTGYLTLAYAPLTDTDLRAYIDFSKTPAARRYNAAMFSGFGKVFEQTSYDLGRAAATFMIQKDT